MHHDLKNPRKEKIAALGIKYELKGETIFLADAKGLTLGTFFNVGEAFAYILGYEAGKGKL